MNQEYQVLVVLDLLKCIEAGKKAGIEIPQNTKRTTNFIR